MAWIREIPFPHILEELRDYSGMWNFKTDKARRVHALCIERGHEELAFRIYIKYKKPIYSDRVMAFGYALMVSQIANK